MNRPLQTSRALTRRTAFGAAAAMAELPGDRDEARAVYGKLLLVAVASDGARPELMQAKAFVGK